MSLHLRHLDEAEFLFEAFEAALDAPHYSLAQVAQGPERRLWAHIDALIVAGPTVAERVLLPILGDLTEQDSRAAAATLALVEGARVGASGGASDPLGVLRGRHASSPSMREEPLWEQIFAIHDACESASRQRAIVRALQLSEGEGLVPWLRAGLADTQSTALAGRLHLLTSHRAVVGLQLGEYLANEDPQVARAAAEAVVLTPDPGPLAGLGPLAHSPDPEVRRATIETALIRRLPGAWESALYWAFTDAPSPFRRRALTWVALLGDEQLHRRLITDLESEDRRGDALWALGFCGRVAAVDAAIEWLGDPLLGRVAGEVVTAIAGLSADEEGCWRAEPEADEDEGLPPLERDQLSADLVLPVDPLLPLPEPAAIASWWASRRGGLDVRVRYLGGRPLTHAAMVEVLTNGPMRRRHALALEVAVRSEGRWLARTRQTTGLQTEEVGGLARLPPLDFQRPLT